MKSLLNLVGISHTPCARDVVPLLKDGTPLLLLREPDNPHDPNAIQVYLQLGYVKKEQAAQLAKLLDILDMKELPAKMLLSRGAYAEMEIEEPEIITDHSESGAL
jgi:hypothetical protein